MADDLGSLHASVVSDIFTSRQSALLADNLDPKVVKKLTSGSKAQYIEGWHAIAEANRIFGFGAWDRELVRCEETNRDLVDVMQNNAKAKQWRVGYLYTVRIIVHGPNGDVRKRDGTGFGTGYSKPEALGEAIESAAKEAETDAMKRALMTFGNPFGLALYDKSKSNVGPSLLEDDEPDAGPSDAGQREQPKTQQATGGDDPSPPKSPPVQPTAPQTLSKGDARPDNGELYKEMRACKTVAELEAWGKANAARVALQPADWKKALREEYVELKDGLQYMADTARDAERAFEEERAS